jgi:hypothetical protein
MTMGTLINALVAAAGYAERISPSVKDTLISICLREEGLHYRAVKYFGESRVASNIIVRWEEIAGIPDSTLRDRLIKTVDKVLENHKRQCQQNNYSDKRNAGG